MQIRRPRGITIPQLMVVTAVGFLGGVYIWQPLILKWKKGQQENVEDKNIATAELKENPTT